MKFSEAIFSRTDQKFSFTEKTLPGPLHPQHVLIRPLWVGICGSDLVALELNVGETLVLGHEWVGEVIQAGTEVTSVKAGDFVTSGNLIKCGYCPGCETSQACSNQYFLSSNQGMMKTLAEFPAASLLKLGKNSGPVTTLLEILAVGENVYNKLKADLTDRKKILVIGAGTLGLSVSLVLKHYGFSSLMTETIPSRIQRARKLGLDCVSLPQLHMDAQHRNAYDIIIDCSGDHLKGKGGWALLDIFGKHGFLGVVLAKYIHEVKFNPMAYFLKNADLRWIQGCTDESLRQAIVNWEDKVKDLGTHMISHVFNYAEVNQAFATAADRENSGRVIIKIQDPTSLP